MLQKVFDRYYQLENQLRHNRNWGFGIGLYFSRALVTLHHGVLFAGNRPQEEGTTGAEFTLLLPIGEEVYRDDDHIAATTQAPLPSQLHQHQQKDVEAQQEGSTDAIADDNEEGADVENPGSNAEAAASEKPRITGSG